MIMTVLYSVKHLMQHRHLHDEPVVRFVLHDAARPVEPLIGDRRIAPNRQAMHEAAVGFRAREPAILHAPVLEAAAQLRIDPAITVGCCGTPFLGVNDMRSEERIGALTSLMYTNNRQR